MRFCLILITGFVFLSSCSNEIDINADFREIPIVHGLLNVEDSVHYLRIQRAFIDENTSALTLAQDANQIYYGDQLEVYVDEYWNNIHLNRFHASRLNGDTIGLVKEVGIFAANPNILYRFPASLSVDNSYRLTVINLVTGDTATALTNLVQDFRVFTPMKEFPIDFTDTIDQFFVEWVTAPLGHVYELGIRVHYEEVDLVTGAANEETVEWQVFKNQRSKSGKGNESMRYSFDKISFYTAMRSLVEEKENVRRDYLGMDFVFYAGGYEILLLYLNNIANSGITELFITEQYTNIEGGLGVFSSRYIMPVENLILSDVALDSLACGRITRHLNFKSSVTHADYPGCGN